MAAAFLTTFLAAGFFAAVFFTAFFATFLAAGFAAFFTTFFAAFLAAGFAAFFTTFFAVAVIAFSLLLLSFLFSRNSSSFLYGLILLYFFSRVNKNRKNILIFLLQEGNEISMKRQHSPRREGFLMITD
ncbi:MAG: hypothetical protein EG826_02945 [Deltaproteobacteria bacterium]|nr:hypothetical protein [Deltaproteobacteria bacterium]